MNMESSGIRPVEPTSRPCGHNMHLRPLIALLGLLGIDQAYSHSALYSRSRRRYESSLDQPFAPRKDNDGKEPRCVSIARTHATILGDATTLGQRTDKRRAAKEPTKCGPALPLNAPA